MDEPKSTLPDITPEKLRTTKIAFTVALIIIGYLGYSGIISPESGDSNETSILPTIFSFGALLTSAMGLWSAEKARKGPLAQATIASAQFEIPAILAFVYSVIVANSPWWLVPVAATYSILCIWFIVPARIEKHV